ncbi:unnamed protein product [marine sediment metagenome]|uniref:Uncharacterized protein n=1 Tax=marine sediment metagenome TaxID=412755 RepID=X0WZK9_9ZZZZ
MYHVGDDGTRHYGATPEERMDAERRHDRIRSAAHSSLEALEAMLEMYLANAKLGDWGYHNKEEAPEVIQARAAIALAKGAQSSGNPGQVKTQEPNS